MALDASSPRTVASYCALCTSRCGALATVTGGRLTGVFRLHDVVMPISGRWECRERHAQTAELNTLF